MRGRFYIRSRAGCALIIRIKQSSTINPLIPSTHIRSCFLSVHTGARKTEKEGARGTIGSDALSKWNGGGSRMKILFERIPMIDAGTVLVSKSAVEARDLWGRKSTRSCFLLILEERGSILGFSLNLGGICTLSPYLSKTEPSSLIFYLLLLSEAWWQEKTDFWCSTLYF